MCRQIFEREFYDTQDPKLAAAAGYKVVDHNQKKMVLGKVADEMPPMVRSSKRGLLDSQKEHGSDNQEMVAVKNGIKRIEGMLHSVPENMGVILGVLYQEYNDTIDKCREYLRTRNPWSTRGKEL